MTKKKSKPSRVKPRTAARTRARVFIIGESPMVETYAALCAARGYEVLVQWNGTSGPVPKSEAPSIKRTSVIPPNTSVGIELTNTDRAAKERNIRKLDSVLPRTSALLSSSVTVSATEQSAWVKQKMRLVGIGALPTLVEKQLVEVAPTPFTPKETVDVVRVFFRSLGKEIAIVQDRVGLVLPRILCQIINEAAFAVQEDVASPRDIDEAMKLGTNYPFGPIEWADRIGLDQVYAVLSALQEDLKEERYRISPLLKQMAAGGVWWGHD